MSAKTNGKRREKKSGDSSFHKQLSRTNKH